MKDNALYLEVDEDITSAIDKLTKSSGTQVQIVVPKRSTMLQSIINLKLLKKAAEQGGKELVLVTNDRIAGDLAGRVGLAVAPSLGAKPVIAEPEMPAELKNGEEVIEADDPEPPAPPPEPATKPPSRRLQLRRQRVPDGPPAAPSTPPEAAAAAGDAAKPAKKGLKVPNFNRLQRRAMWGGLAVFLVVGYIAGMYFFSSAKVTLYANGTKVDIDTNFAIDPEAKSTDTAKAVLAGQTVTVTKDLSGPFTPTGKKDVGTKASGQMTVHNASSTTPQTLVAGTRFVAPDGKVFRSQQDITVPVATYPTGPPGIPGKATVTVDADANGDTYNEGPADYTLPALSSSVISAQGAQMAGGTSKIATVVTQNDVDQAKADLLAKDKSNATRDLKGKVPSGYIQLEPSQATNVTTTSPAPAVNAEGTTGTLSIKVNYSVLAVKSSDYKALIEAQETKQVGAENQIYDDGLDAAQLTVSDKDSSGRQTFHLTTEAYGGRKLDKAGIAKQLKGKRFGDAADLANRLPGISKAEIALWPGWSSNLPARPDKIKIVIEVAEAK
jgi:hypothetical protein